MRKLPVTCDKSLVWALTNDRIDLKPTDLACDARLPTCQGDRQLIYPACSQYKSYIFENSVLNELIASLIILQMC